MSSSTLSPSSSCSSSTPPIIPNPFASVGDLQSNCTFSSFSDVSESLHDWDPFKTYNLEIRLVDLPETAPTFTDGLKLGLRPRSHTASYLESSVTQHSLSSPEGSLTDHRYLTTQLALSPYSNSHVADSTQYPVLPPIKRLPTLTSSLADSTNFSLSDFDNVSNHDSHSILSDQEDLETTDVISHEDLDHPTKTVIKRWFSTADIYGLGREKFIGDSSDVDAPKSENLPAYITPPTTSSAFFPPSSTNEVAQSPANSATSGSGFTFPAHSLQSSPSLQSFFTNREIRPLPTPPVKAPNSQKPSRWVPPSSWKSPKDKVASDLQDSPPPSPRPHSALQMASQTRIRTDPTVLRPNRRSLRRPQTAPDGPSRPPINFDRSPLVLLGKGLPQTRNFLKFHKTALPSQSDLELASKLEVIDQCGGRIPFGALFRDQKTVIIFIRHFWCPSCQDYMYSLTNSVSRDMLDRNGIKLIVVSNGSHSMIKSYRKIFKFPFRLYTDPSLHVYHALGMSLRTSEAGPQSECGGYVKHGVITGAAMVVKNALANGLPVWGKGGDNQQLGGEFVLGPGLSCSYAHRMHTTRSHSPVLSVLTAAGLTVRAKVYMHSQVTISVSTVSDDDSWMAKRAKRLRSLRNKKEERRYGSMWSIE